MTRTCPFCPRRVDSVQFACSVHWYAALTPAQRTRANQAYVGWLQGDVTRDELHGVWWAIVDEVNAANQPQPSGGLFDGR